MLRMYAVDGCQHCNKAKAYLAEHGVECEIIKPHSDPVIGNGLAIIFPGQAPRFPILMDFHNNHLSIGFSKEDYDKAIAAVLGASLPNGSPAPQRPPSEAQNIPQEPPSEAQGTAGVPDVLGIMDGLSVDARPNGGA